MKHLDEHSMQLLAEGNHNLLSREESAHLKTCTSCQMQVRIYRQMFQGLKAEEMNVLSPGFSDKVMARIAAQGNPRFALNDLLILIIPLFAIAGGIFSFYYFRIDFLQMLLRPFQDLFQSIGPDKVLIVGIVVLLGGLALIDQFILKKRFG